MFLIYTILLNQRENFSKLEKKSDTIKMSFDFKKRGSSKKIIKKALTKNEKNFYLFFHLPSFLYDQISIKYTKNQYFIYKFILSIKKNLSN